MSSKNTLNVKIKAETTELEKGLKSAERNIKNFSKGLESIGTGLTKLSVPFAALGTMAVKASLSVDEALKQIGIKTGATGKNLKSLQESFKNVAKDSPESFDKISATIGDVNTRLGITGKTLENVTKAILDASDMNKEDSGGMLTNVTKAINDLGISGNDAVGFMDKLFVASQQTGISITDLSGSMYQYGSILRQMGFDTDTTIAMFSKFQKEGVNTELVIGSLRIAASNLAKANIPLKEGLASAIEQIKNAKSPTDALSKSIKLFGSRAGADMAAAIREGRFSLDDLVSSLQDADGAISKADDASETFSEKIAILKNQFNLLLSPLGDTIVKILTEWIPSLENGSIKVNETTVKMAMLTAAFGVGTIAAGKLVSSIADICSGLRSLIKLIPKVTPFLLKYGKYTGPAALIGAGIGAGSIFYSGVKQQLSYEDMRTALGKKAPQMPTFDKKNKSAKMAEYNKKLTEAYNNLINPKIEETTTTTNKNNKTPTKTTLGNVDLDFNKLGKSAGKTGSKADEAAKALEKLKDKARESTKYYDVLISKAPKSLYSTDTKSVSPLTADDWSSINSTSISSIGKDLSQGWIDNSNALTQYEALLQTIPEGTDEFYNCKDAILEVQKAIAESNIDKLNEQLSDGTIKLPEYTAQINTLKAEFDGITPIITKLSTAQDEASKNAKKHKSELIDLNELTIKWAQSFQDGIADIIVNGGSLTDMLADIGKEMEKVAIKLILFGKDGISGVFGNLFSGLFSSNAKGGLYSGSGISSYSSSVVSSPTIFPFAKGVGLMGEAGSEAIMPLSRNSNGELGVKVADNSSGTVKDGSNINITINNNGSGEMSETQSKEMGNSIRSMIDSRFYELYGVMGRTGRYSYSR